MAAKQTFSCVLEKHPTMNATVIAVPFDVEAAFGSKRVPVIATINTAEYRGTIVRMAGKYLLGLPREFRERARIEVGNNIVVTLEKDLAPRVVTLPADFAKALKKNKDAAAEWAKLSYSHRKEYVGAIEEAKKPETRTRRIEGAIRMIAARGNK
jgi:hypothetical protein